MNRTLTVCIALFSCMILLASSAVADISSLDDLLNGDQLIQGNSTFSNFELLADLGTSSIDTSQVFVETDGASGLVFIGNGQFALDAGDDSIVFQIGFDVETTGTSWGRTNTDLSLGDPQAADVGLIDLFNSVSDPSSQLLAETNAVVDPAFGLNVLNDSQLLADPQSSVDFVSSFSLFADPSSAVSIDAFRVSLAVPEPNSAILICGLTLMSTIRRRK